MKILKTWLNVLLHPKETFAAEKENSSLNKGIYTLFLALLISKGIYIIIKLVFLGVLQDISNVSMLPNVIVDIIFLLFIQGIIFIPAKLLGGQGNIKQQFYLFSLVYAPLAIIFAVISVIQFFPAGSIILLAVNILLLVYEAYLITIVIKETHNFSFMKALVTWLIPLIVLIVLMVLGTLIFMFSISPGYATETGQGLFSLIR